VRGGANDIAQSPGTTRHIHLGESSVASAPMRLPVLLAVAVVRTSRERGA
jgi:hypothetical protein